jgi:hypothetical protein
LHALVSAEALRGAWAAELGKRGPVSGVGVQVTEPGPSGMVVVQVAVRLERGELTVAMSVDDEGRLTGLRLTRTTGPWQPPDYADLETGFP